MNDILFAVPNNTSRFTKVKFLNAGVGPAINLSFSVEREETVSHEIDGHFCHTPTRQLAEKSSVSLGILILSAAHSCEQSELVLHYRDRDGRSYSQRHSFDRVYNGRIQEFDLKIRQELLSD